ncbi:hypothetical protein A2767_05635 [Candidatus Roizmanbacteria bacterium RIFCSPHIGHO2_01_FULL_35_10]|uniref:Nickel/cobalt efflux system n=1 Tax=Candidatus Roizmanbacteria bacterium RIFCSPLOWO2_01_FULL_35_13 TaxID=1802055 RepID=A0A1F7IBN7_9BACT|nr:MAG: hypothetical protein A2767_05635 [Candidatus Roizmanbacteria bacterium RIFCSPHIGHO2_01_FULL_35_10]OGK40774.1 MAG: hypothetical protein A3A74_04105 [Candidatus Roizmanbacteria bacterium RIFCSPLOWO2_01_FULL_35_13]
MSINFSQLSVFFLALLLGLRHGIDWDHIAAITDVTGTSDHRHEALFSGFLYIIGHAFVVIILGLAAIAVGVNLPDWVDPIMEKFVGITLVLVGVWLLISILRYGKNFKLKSRWILVLDFVNKISLFLHNKIPHKHEHQELQQVEGKNVWKAAFTIGMIHGVGAETPTQVLLFVTAAGVGHGIGGILLLFTFVFGLALSNTAISLFSIFGFAKAKKNSNIYVGLGLITACFSLFVGLSYFL